MPTPPLLQKVSTASTRSLILSIFSGQPHINKLLGCGKKFFTPYPPFPLKQGSKRSVIWVINHHTSTRPSIQRGSLSQWNDLVQCSLQEKFFIEFLLYSGHSNCTTICYVLYRKLIKGCSWILSFQQMYSLGDDVENKTCSWALSWSDWTLNICFVNMLNNDLSCCTFDTPIVQHCSRYCTKS